MGGFFGIVFVSGSGGASGAARLGGPLAFASPAGSIAAAPAGFSTSIGVLNVTLAAGNATWTSLTAGAAGQLLSIRNKDAANSLTLPQANWGGPLDLILPPGAEVLVYYDNSMAAWQIST